MKSNLFSRYRQGLSRIQPLVLVAVAAISLALSYMAVNQPLSEFLRARAPNYRLSIKVLEETNPNAIPNREVWIEEMTVDTVNDLKELFDGSTPHNGFEYRIAEDYGYSHDVITCTDGEGSEISFSWPVGKAFSCKFWKQHLSGIIQISLMVGEETVQEETVDLFADKPDQYYTYAVPEGTERGRALGAVDLFCQ